MILFFVTVTILFVQVGVFLSQASLNRQNENDDGTAGKSRPSYGIFGTSPTAKNVPIILLGLPRSGSLAVHEYFQCQGWKSAHYCCGGGTDNVAADKKSLTRFPCLDEAGPTCGECVLKNLKGHRPAFMDCNSNIMTSKNHPDGMMIIWSQFDVETADAWFLPQHFALGLLHQAYPNATWILNTIGSAREWAESVYHWHGMTRRFLTTFGVPVEPTIPSPRPPPPRETDRVTAEEIEADMQRQLESQVYNQTEHLRKLAVLQRIYENHTATVYQWARQFPSHPFVHITVDEDDATSLSNFLDQTFLGLLGTDDAVQKNTKTCQWKFQPPTDDWKDFSFPFGT